MNLMNTITFMPMIMPRISEGGNLADLPIVLLTFVIAGVILIILGIFVNILRAKFSQGFGYTPIYWENIKPNIDNSLLGGLCGFFGCVFIGASLLIGLVAGIYWFIITL